MTTNDHDLDDFSDDDAQPDELEDGEGRTAPPPAAEPDPYAPHGRDADGNALAPFGFKVNGHPKRAPGGRRVGSRLTPQKKVNKALEFLLDEVLLMTKEERKRWRLEDPTTFFSVIRKILPAYEVQKDAGGEVEIRLTYDLTKFGYRDGTPMPVEPAAGVALNDMELGRVDGSPTIEELLIEMCNKRGVTLKTEPRAMDAAELFDYLQAHPVVAAGLQRLLQAELEGSGAAQLPGGGQGA